MNARILTTYMACNCEVSVGHYQRRAGCGNCAVMNSCKVCKSDQLAEVAANLPLIACAGSGKTEVVARRVVHLLRSEGGGLAPRNIIAFTFTDKAAAGDRLSPEHALAVVLP